MSTNADAAASGRDASSLGLGRTRSGEGVSGVDADWALGIDRIAAAIRGAGGDQGQIPTGPERRGLANLSRVWSIVIPVVALLMPIVMAILPRYFDLGGLEDLVRTLAFGTNVSGGERLFILFFAPLALFLVPLVCVVVAAVGARFGNATRWKRAGSGLSVGVFGLAAVSAAVMVMLGAGGDATTHLVIWLTCAYVVAVATFLYWLVGYVPGVDLTLRDYGTSVVVGVFVTVGAFSMLIGIDRNL